VKDEGDAMVLDQDLAEKGYKIGLFGQMIKQESAHGSKSSEDPPGEQEEGDEEERPSS